ncbi:MAG: BzdZ [Blastococcus sp.]|nr:BzdZ [Blastococcus sp.]
MAEPHPIDLTGRAAVVTGGAQGIGRAVADSFAAAGAGVVLVDVDEARVTAAAEEMVRAGHTAVAVAADVGDEAAVERAAEAATGDLGELAVWVNNAGVTRPAMLHKMTADDFDLVMRVHARGTFLGLRAAARRMREAGTRGSIINVTSSAGLNGTIGQINYAAAKGAIIAMTKSGARELGRYGIRVNAVSPAAATEMTETIRSDERFAQQYLERIPLGRWAEADEVANAFLFLAGSSSDYVTGQVLCIDGGSYMAS